MGVGDEIMASGEALARYEKIKRPISILDWRGRVRAHPVWDGLDFINQKASRRNDREATIINSGRARPYMARMTHERFYFNTMYRAKPGRLALTPVELAMSAGLPAGYIVVEPFTKSKIHQNKQWGQAKWNELVLRLRVAGRYVVQVGPVGGVPIPGANYRATIDLRAAAGVLAGAAGAVLPEGGLHHAAAALGVPAVVVFGGYISPAITGYAMHTNIGTGEACGARLPCVHCTAAMLAISVEQVLDAFNELESKCGREKEIRGKTTASVSGDEVTLRGSIFN